MLDKLLLDIKSEDYKCLIDENITSYLKKKGLDDKEIEIEKSKHHNPVLNRDQYVKQLSESICNYFNKPWGFENNTILLDGTWGTGKSWILRQSEYVINTKLSNEINWLNFSAHLYLDEKELFFDLYDTFHDPNYLKKLITNKDQGFTDAQKQDALLRSLHWTNKAINLFGQNRQTFVRLILPLSTALLTAAGLGWLPMVSKIAYDILAPFMVINLREWGINEDNINLFKNVFGKVNEYALDNLENKVEQTEEKINKKEISNLFSTKKTVVVIDDLDRCHEDKLWKIFSMLSLFDGQDNILFVLAGSSNYMIKILDKKYHVKGEGENFLAKFIGGWVILDMVDLENHLFIEKGVKNLEDFMKLVDICYKFFPISTYREMKSQYYLKLENYTNQNLIQYLLKYILIYYSINNKELYTSIFKDNELIKHSALVFYTKTFNSLQKSSFTTLDEVFDQQLKEDKRLLLEQLEYLLILIGKFNINDLEQLRISEDYSSKPKPEYSNFKLAYLDRIANLMTKFSI